MASEIQNRMTLKDMKALPLNVALLIEEMANKLNELEGTVESWYERIHWPDLSDWTYTGPFALSKDGTDATGKTLKIAPGVIHYGGEYPQAVTPASVLLDASDASQTLYIYGFTQIVAGSGYFDGFTVAATDNIGDIMETTKYQRKDLLGVITTDANSNILTVTQHHYGNIKGFGLIEYDNDYCISGWPDAAG